MIYHSVRQFTIGVFQDILQWWKWYLTEVSWQFLIAFAAYVGVCVFLYGLLKKVSHETWHLPGPPERLLLITAHPDDEVMFFGPLIYWIVRLKSSQIYLLCFTIGGHKRRKEELWACVNKLGIPEAHVTILMNTELPDDPTVQWPEDVVGDSILEHIESLGINAVVTFDKHGVSQHKNHSSLYYAVASLSIGKRIPSYCRLYVLDSVNIFRKYTQLLDLPFSLLSSSYLYLVTYNQRQYIRTAMQAHESQYVWFRKLYMIFSRYTFINTLREVSSSDLELDLQYDD